MEYILKFLENEKKKKDISVKEYPNGEKIIFDNYSKSNVLHTYFKSLSDDQIIDLENEVNIAQQAAYKFPEWYKQFFKTTNGLNLFFGALVFYGEQTPLVIDEKYGKIRALIERDNPSWIAPFNLRTTNSVKFDISSKKRWLTIGSYNYDGTQIAIDFKKDCIIAMYALPVTLTIKELRQMKESDFEKLIIYEWKDFEAFFKAETNRLSEVIDSYTWEGQECFTAWKKTLPQGHKNYEK